jgi:hypothetical protein
MIPIFILFVLDFSSLTINEQYLACISHFNWTAQLSFITFSVITAISGDFSINQSFLLQYHEPYSSILIF